MAVQGSGLGAGPDKGAFKDQQSYDARSGAAKKTQTSFPTHKAMADQQNYRNVGPSNPGQGPDAGGPEPMDGGIPGPNRGKTLRRTPTAGLERTPWGQRGAAPDMSPSYSSGKQLDSSLAGRVLGEAILSGAKSIPSSTSEASGPAKAYNGKAGS